MDLQCDEAIERLRDLRGVFPPPLSLDERIERAVEEISDWYSAKEWMGINALIYALPHEWLWLSPSTAEESIVMDAGGFFNLTDIKESEVYPGPLRRKAKVIEGPLSEEFAVRKLASQGIDPEAIVSYIRYKLDLAIARTRI